MESEFLGKKFYGHPGFYKLLQEMAELHSRKNHDYAGSEQPLRNFYKCKDMGISPFIGIMVRLSDKWARLESFIVQGKLEVSEESIVDTLMDNAVYSLLAILLYKEELDNNKVIEKVPGKTPGLPTEEEFSQIKNPLGSRLR